MASQVSAGSPDGQRPAKRARSAIACQRCKQRKQRCDNGFPSCGNCAGAGVSTSCFYGANIIYPAEYVTSLESHIVNLEQKLVAFDPNVAADHMIERPTPPWSNANTPASHTKNNDLQNTAAAAAASSSPSQNAGQNLEIGTGFVALSSNEYLGTSSGLPLAKIVQSAINLAVLTAAQTALQDPKNGSATRNYSDVENDNTQKDSILTKASMPSDAVGDKLIHAYTDKVHSKQPFLSKTKLRRLHQRRNELFPSGKVSKEQSLAERLDFFTLHMVYAIGARYLQLSDDYDYIAPEAHYAAAIQDINIIFDVQSIENLECMLLLAIYQLRSPSGPGIWWMIGITMRHCLDSGLHRKSNLAHLPDQRRKRLFWTVYMLERSVARTLGRPCCVTDREIDVDLPANVSDDIEDEAELAAAIEQSLQNPRQFTSLSPAIHIMRIQKIESKIHHTMYRVDKETSAIPPHKIARLREALEDWKSQIPNVVPPTNEDESIPYSNSDYHMIQYHKAILLLLLPLLPTLPPKHPDFRLCASSAGHICQLYKQLHDQQRYISYSLLALHANFVAGLTMVYCFSKDKSIFDWKFSSDIRACSTVIYIIAERWPATRKVRNAFETLVSATIEGGNSTLSKESVSKESVSKEGGILQAESNMPTENNTPSESTLGQSNATGDNHGSPLHFVDPTNDFWGLFETVLDDKESSWRWPEEGFYNAMGAFPEYGWKL
ncbi:hypothetical protein B7463_g12469, partial [Scytalidium lignicola]